MFATSSDLSYSSSLTAPRSFPLFPLVEEVEVEALLLPLVVAVVLLPPPNLKRRRKRRQRRVQRLN
jgi:hypothetical protein